ncbi:NAD(P)H-dependent oxidoreductase [bacterium]|nr:NAD(P)H-dependent oxidoreductase [bacterium]
MRTLIVHYTLRDTLSNTKKIMSMFADKVKGELDWLDLGHDFPDYFTEENLGAYMKRNYMKQELTTEEKKSIEKMDKMTEQIKKADVVLLAFPLYNFSMPGAVKSWFDSILQKGETWDMGGNGYIGLMKDKKALIFMTSGGVYSGAMKAWEHGLSLSETLFKFMGFSEIETFHAEGLAFGEPKISEEFKKAEEKINLLTEKWYK